MCTKLSKSFCFRKEEEEEKKKKNETRALLFLLLFLLPFFRKRISSYRFTEFYNSTHEVIIMNYSFK